MHIVLALLSVYVFIVIGYFSKYFFKERIDENSFILFSVYFLQPMLAFWGLTKRPFDFDLLLAPSLYFGITLLAIAISALIAYLAFKDQKERSIITIAGSIGNTGNLGIPLGIALFGEGSIAFTSMMNLANVFIVYTIGVFFYSRGNFSVKDSFKNIFKLPLIWFSVAALLYNAKGLSTPLFVDNALEMGSYAAMVTQLAIFGMYLYSVRLKELNKKVLFYVNAIKFVLIPLLGIVVLKSLDIESFLAKVILLELIVPLAVTNVNLGALYQCKPTLVTSAVFVSSLLFIPYIYFMHLFMENYF